MRGKTRAALVVGVSATALIASACGGSGGGSTTTAQPQGKAGGKVTVDGCTPQNPLVPVNTNETCGGDILDIINARLVRYDPKDAHPINDIAEKIETSDNQTFTVKIKKGYKFHDGTEIKAKNFVDAWNYGAYGPNGQLANSFFEVIEGYEDLNPAAPKDKAAPTPTPKAKELSGLKVVDDNTFTIKTNGKVSNLQVRLGYAAYAPMPDSFFKDPKAYGEKPIGSGPYKLENWDKTAGITLTKFKDYSGEIKGNPDTIFFKNYTSQDAAYNDLRAGQIDVQRLLPTSAMAGEKYKSDLGDRTVARETGTFQSISLPPEATDPSLKNVKLRQAISMAIDRETIIKQILAGQRKAATGWVSPVVDGYKADACGEFCKFDATKAKALFQEAGGYNGTLTLSYNTNGDHKAWTEAVCNQLKQNLGVNCVATGITEFSEFRKAITGKTMKGLFRTGWQMDYPSIENFLAPLYKTGASSNDSSYSNPEFDKLLTEAAAQTDPAQANAKYQQAESMLKDGFPVIPMWYGKVTAGFNDKVTNVTLTPFGTVDLASVQTKG